MSLKDAQLADVLRNLEKITGLEIDTSAVDTSGLLTLELQDEPWEEGLRRSLYQNHLRYELRDDRIVVLEE